MHELPIVARFLLICTRNLENTMIARYTRPEMARIWEDRRRYQVWLKVEMAVCEEMARAKIIPPRIGESSRKPATLF